jgi:hypothetical protein
MSSPTDDWADYQRRRWTRENAYLYICPDAHRFVRPDAGRFLRPGEKLDRYWERPEYQSPAMRAYAREPRPSGPAADVAPAGYAGAASNARWLSAEAALSSGPSDSDILKLKSDLAALRVHLAVINLEVRRTRAQGLPPLTEADEGWQIILRGLARFQDACRKAGLQNVFGKAGFNPAQPRVPVGNPDGGQWTSGGGSGDRPGGGAAGDGTDGGRNDPRVLSDATPDNGWKPGARYAQAVSEAQVTLAAGRGGIAKQFLKLSLREFVSRYCRASINREMPKEFEDLSIADVLEIAKGGNARARRCVKLLSRGRFRKDD